MPADWCASLGHPDFAAAWRDIVDPALCESVPENAGGLLNLWELGIGSALPEVATPLQAGDIAIVTAFGLEAGAIWTGERWAIRGQRTMHWIAADGAVIVKAWRP